MSREHDTQLSTDGESGLVERLRHAEAELDRLLREDDLTGLLNRRTFRRSLIAHLGGAARHGTPLSVARIDVDHFKLVNTIPGDFRVGDEVLRRVAQILRGSARDGDLFGRWGGDEFAAVFPRTDRGEAVAACERLLAAIARDDWNRVHARVRVTLSIGIADLADGGSADALLAAADRRLEEAKLTGRNRVAAA
jgi:diguanylate cyclase (GGDEF)-like protein